MTAKSLSRYHRECKDCGKHIQKTMPVIEIRDLNGPLRVRCSNCETINQIHNRKVVQ